MRHITIDNAHQLPSYEDGATVEWTQLGDNEDWTVTHHRDIDYWIATRFEFDEDADDWQEVETLNGQDAKVFVRSLGITLYSTKA